MQLELIVESASLTLVFLVFDGKRGYGGACFPKDTAAFASFAGSFSTLEKVIEENNKYRKDYDKDERELAQNVSYG